MPSASTNLILTHFSGPHHFVAFNEIMRLAGVIPVADRWPQENKSIALNQGVFSLSQWSYDLGSTSAAAEVTGGLKLIGNVENTILQLTRYELHILGTNVFYSHMQSSLVREWDEVVYNEWCSLVSSA